MKKLSFIILLVVVLAGCSSKGMTTIDEVYESKPAVIETMSSDVNVYTVAGSGQGVVVAEDERNKYIEVDLALVSQHPISLVETSIGKQYKADIVGFNEKTEKAYLHIKCSVDLNEEIEAVNIDSLKQKLTYEDRLALKDKYAQMSEEKPAQQIADYEEEIFTYNSDELEAFVYSFEKANDKETYIANDLLLDVLDKASEFNTTYKLKEVESVSIQKTNIVVKGLVEFSTKGEVSEGVIVYTIVPIADEYKIMQLQLSEN